jgi:hypothetical protein
MVVVVPLSTDCVDDGSADKARRREGNFMTKAFDAGVLRITVATSAALLAAGCSNNSVAGQPTRLCVDGSNRRIADANCPSSGGARGGGGHAYYIGSGQRVPSVGEEATGGSVRAASGISYSSAPESVTRGGFGGSGEGHGGGSGGE